MTSSQRMTSSNTTGPNASKPDSDGSNVTRSSVNGSSATGSARASAAAHPASLVRARLLLLARSIARACGRAQIFSQAASLAFLSMTAIVPVATVILTVMASVPAFAELRDQLQAFLAANFLLPQVADQIMGYINDFAAAAGRLSVVGTLAFVATAFTTMLTVDHALNEIWGSPEPRPIVYRLLIYWAALTVGPIVLAAVIAMRIEDVLSSFGGSMLGAPTWLPWLLMTLLLSLIYHVVPNRRVRFGHALFGGAVAALLLEALKAGLQYYITAYPTYQAVYGAFSVLPVFLLWLYFAWFAVLLGAIVAANLGYPELGGEHLVSPRQEFERGRRVLEVLVRAAHGGHGVQVSALAGLMDRNAATARRTGQALVRLGYMVRIAPGAAALPATAIARQTRGPRGVEAGRGSGRQKGESLFGGEAAVDDATGWRHDAGDRSGTVDLDDAVDFAGAAEHDHGDRPRPGLSGPSGQGDPGGPGSAGRDRVDGLHRGAMAPPDDQSDDERQSGMVPAREIWAETWMATPQLASMTLRLLYDQVWIQGRLEDRSAAVRRPAWWRRRFTRQMPVPASQAAPSDAEIDRPLGELAGAAGPSHIGQVESWRRWG